MGERTPTGRRPGTGTTTGAPVGRRRAAGRPPGSAPSGGRLRVVGGTPDGTPGDALGEPLEDAPAAPDATGGEHPYAGAHAPAGLTVLEGGGTGYSDSPEDYEPPEGAEAEDAETAASSGITAEEEVRRAGVALLDLVLSEEYAWAIYERQCEEGLIGMATRARELRLALEERGEDHDQGAVEAAITESALNTHPGSPAAAWELLHSPEIVCREYPVNERDGAVAALVDVVSKEEGLYKTLTHVALDPDGPGERHLLAASREAYAALLRRGLRFRPRGFSDHVWRALKEVLPSAPGVRWDEAWADGLMRRASKYVGKSVAPEGYDGDVAGVVRAEAEVCEAYAAEDRRRYRRAVGAWAEATRRAAGGNPFGARRRPPPELGRRATRKVTPEGVSKCT